MNDQETISSSRTNRPVETMGYPDYDFPNIGRSFVTAVEVLDFLVAYTKHFKVDEKIKFEHLVVRVALTDDDKWEVCVMQ